MAERTGKQTRLVDFQLYARSGFADGQQRPINQALFATFEPVRLWLKEHKIEAPFRKLVVTFADEASSARWHGSVEIAIGVCEVTEAVSPAALERGAGDHGWVLGAVEHALTCVAREAGWASEDLAAAVAEMSSRVWPLVHFFARLAKVDRTSGVRCRPWLSARPGETQIGVRLESANVERNVTVLSRPGPVYLEDEFPVAKSIIRHRDFVLVDKAGKVLASVPIDDPGLP
jgi:hypothetical protein